jgi:hypothetical protein
MVEFIVLLTCAWDNNVTMTEYFLNLMTFQLFKLFSCRHEELRCIRIIIDHPCGRLLVQGPPIFISTFHTLLDVC